MNELKDIIAYFIANSPCALYKTEIVKMVYMFEYYHVQTYGSQYSDTKFIRYYYGPYAQAIEENIEFLIDEEIISQEEINYPDRTVYLHKCNNKNVIELFPLDSKKRHIADNIIDELSGKPYNQLINIVYSTPPMAKILKEEESHNTKYKGKVLDMTQCRPIKKYSKERIEAARKRLDKSSRGSDREYYAHILEQKEAYDELRRRANSCLNK